MLIDDVYKSTAGGFGDMTREEHCQFELLREDGKSIASIMMRKYMSTWHLTQRIPILQPGRLQPAAIHLNLLWEPPHKVVVDLAAALGNARCLADDRRLRDLTNNEPIGLVRVSHAIGKRLYARFPSVMCTSPYHAMRSGWASSPAPE